MDNILDGLDKVFKIPEGWYIAAYDYIVDNFEGYSGYYRIELNSATEPYSSGYFGYGNSLLSAIDDWKGSMKYD